MLWTPLQIIFKFQKQWTDISRIFSNLKLRVSIDSYKNAFS